MDFLRHSFLYKHANPKGKNAMVSVIMSYVSNTEHNKCFPFFVRTRLLEEINNYKENFSRFTFKRQFLYKKLAKIDFVVKLKIREFDF